MKFRVRLTHKEQVEVEAESSTQALELAENQIEAKHLSFSPNSWTVKEIEE